MPRQHAADRGADPPAATGYQRDFPFQKHLVTLTRPFEIAN
jgi:hypothetical protein